jgi:hypothetical protein
VLVIGIIGVLTGCAARRATAPAPVSPSRGVDDLSVLIRQGSYRCLERAFDEAQTRKASSHAFEAAALLVLRSKELGLVLRAIAVLDKTKNTR